MQIPESGQHGPVAVRTSIDMAGAIGLAFLIYFRARAAGRRPQALPISAIQVRGRQKIGRLSAEIIKDPADVSPLAALRSLYL